mmetsp:Transcript_12693/g.19013  ORF Transcript_12693/g.19013 Transcript_12693/m.19013 type:complete len:200 (+) Transcript_12693:80-679(+)
MDLKHNSTLFMAMAAMATIALTAGLLTSSQHLGRAAAAQVRPTFGAHLRPALSPRRSQYMEKLRGYHCQVPCGIFDDPKTVEEVKEACTTIRKAVDQINELAPDMSTTATFNQMTRWVMTKEEHGNKIISLISEYCLCQRVKPVGDPKSPFTEEKDYIDALKAHHAVMLAAVKAKQSTAISDVDALDHAVADFGKMYTS